MGTYTSRGIMVNSGCLSFIENQFHFETGGFLYHLNVLQVESFKLQTLF